MTATATAALQDDSYALFDEFIQYPESPSPSPIPVETSRSSDSTCRSDIPTPPSSTHSPYLQLHFQQSSTEGDVASPRELVNAATSGNALNYNQSRPPVAELLRPVDHNETLAPIPQDWPAASCAGTQTQAEGFGCNHAHAQPQSSPLAALLYSNASGPLQCHLGTEAMGLEEHYDGSQPSRPSQSHYQVMSMPVEYPRIGLPSGLNEGLWDNMMQPGNTDPAHGFPSTGDQTSLWNNLPIRPLEEEPWTAYNMPQQNPLPPRVATQQVPSHAQYSRPVTSAQRILPNGAISRPREARSLIPREGLNRQMNSSLSPEMSSHVPVAARISGPQRNRAGGRNRPLNEEQRKHAKVLRREHACWVCALQRVSCTAGPVCLKCAERLSIGTSPLGCNRTVLQEMIDQFLPIRMTEVHDPEVVKLFVKGSMERWVGDQGSRGLTVHLTVGYGPTIPWLMHEFVPRQQEVVLLMQWKTDSTGKVTCIRKKSPPLAIKHVSKAESQGFVKFIDDLIENPHNLDDFQETYCGDQEDDPFRTELIKLLCRLFKDLPANAEDTTLREDLKMGLRTIIATDIMLHHVALDDGSRDDAIRQMLNPEYNDPSAYTTFTSPKLVNRQLKSFIQTIQKNFCIEVLKRLHHILRMHKGQQKTRTWMSSFVLMLTMAMCQEELEHSRYLRADGEAKRGEQEPQLALEQARRDVRHADTGFDFLLTLFHCKYSPQKRYVASLVDWMGKTKHVAEDRFLERLCRLGNERRLYLLTRKIQEVQSAYDKRHKSRLVARFLVGFMALSQPGALFL